MKLLYSIIWDVVLFLCILSIFLHGYILGIPIIDLISFVSILGSICAGIEKIRQEKKYYGYAQILITVILLIIIIVRKCM